MRRRNLSRLDLADRVLSRDQVLSKTAGLFPTPATATELLERPRPRVRARRLPRLRRVVYAPEFLMVAAIAILVTCVLLGGVLHNDVIVLCGLAGPLALAIACCLATRAHRVRQRNF